MLCFIAGRQQVPGRVPRLYVHQAALGPHQGGRAPRQHDHLVRAHARPDARAHRQMVPHHHQRKLPVAERRQLHLPRLVRLVLLGSRSLSCVKYKEWRKKMRSDLTRFWIDFILSQFNLILESIVPSKY